MIKLKGDLKKRTIELLNQRGITLEAIAELTYFLQEKYVPNLTMKECITSVRAVVEKREVQTAVITGIEIDIACEKGHFGTELTDMLMNDYPLYGIDEILVLSIVNVYGSIGLTNFGYIDKLKPGIMGEIDQKGKEKDRCNTFLDDIVGAIAAAAASRIAHSQGD
jgi:phosphatidylglycerophosphatase A